MNIVDTKVKGDWTEKKEKERKWTGDESLFFISKQQLVVHLIQTINTHDEHK